MKENNLQRNAFCVFIHTVENKLFATFSNIQGYALIFLMVTSKSFHIFHFYYIGIKAIIVLQFIAVLCITD